MAHFDTILIAPAETDLIDTLLRATDSANREVRLLPLSRGHWQEFVLQMRRLREGRRQWSDVQRGETGRVVVSWWTDPVGRVHCRILGGNSRDGSYRRLTPVNSDPRPALWQVYPERVFFRVRHGQEQCLTVCACGVAGTPEAIGWMGTRCAACHDRLEEGLPTPPDRVSASTFLHQGLDDHGPTFSPDGEWLATVQKPGANLSMLCLVRPGAEAVQMTLLREEPSCLAFSPDASLLAYSEGTDRLLVREVVGGGLVLDAAGLEELTGAAFTPDGTGLAAASTGGVWLWRCRPGGGWQFVCHRDPPASALAFNTRGDRLATATMERLVLYRVHGDDLVPFAEQENRSHWPAVQLQFLDEDRSLVCLYTHDMSVTALYQEFSHALGFSTRVDHLSCAGVRLHLDRRHDLRDLGKACLSPDGRFVAGLPRGGEFVQFADAASGVLLDALNWDPRKPLMTLGFSPDNQTLAVVNDRQCGKLLPWRLLLQV